MVNWSYFDLNGSWQSAASLPGLLSANEITASQYLIITWQFCSHHKNIFVQVCQRMSALREVNLVWSQSDAVALVLMASAVPGGVRSSFTSGPSSPSCWIAGTEFCSFIFLNYFTFFFLAKPLAIRFWFFKWRSRTKLVHLCLYFIVVRQEWSLACVWREVQMLFCRYVS